MHSHSSLSAPTSSNGTRALHVASEAVAIDPPPPAERAFASRAFTFTPGEAIAALVSIGLLVYCVVQVF